MTEKIISKKTKTTSKKVQYCGTQTWINKDTGECEEFEVTKIQERDFNFTKVFMENFLMDLDSLGNKKLKVAIHICENINKEGYFIGTISQICKKTGFSDKTVRTTIKSLIDCKFMKRVTPGCYLINADHLFKGSHSQRMNVLKQYYNE